MATAAGLIAGCAEESQDSQPAIEESPSTAPLSLSTVGLQLYTLRYLMEDDFVGPIRKAAEIGYDEFEFAGYGGMTGQQIRSLLDELQVSSPATHISSSEFRHTLDEVIERSLTIGHTYLICPHPGDEPYETIDDYKAMAAFFNEVGMKCGEAGLQFGYHNHGFEFEEIDGVIPMNVLLEETDPELVSIELDLHWISVAGKDAIEYFEAYPGRFPLCHVKDMTADKQLADVGSGVIDFASIFAHAEQAGLEHYIVEHDAPGDAIQSITNSFEHLTSGA